MTTQTNLFETEPKRTEPNSAFQKFLKKLIKEGYVMSRKRVNGQLTHTFKRGTEK